MSPLERHLAELVTAIVRAEVAPLRAELERLRAAADAPGGWATPEQAAELLGTTPKTVRRWAAAGRLRARRDGARWRIDRSALPEAAPASPEDHAGRALVALRR